MRVISFVSDRGLPALLVTTMVTLASAASAAQPAGPPLMPTRDVTVLYSVMPEGAPQPQAVRVYFHGGGGAMRIDGPQGPDGALAGDMILDRTARTMTVVLNQPKVYMEIPEREEIRSPFVLDSSMQFTRASTASVAGLPCTQWTIVTGKGNATACITEDGVVLSEEGVDGQGARGKLAAQTVQYGPLPASLFVPPAGFTRTAHPQGMGGGMEGPPGPMTGPGGMPPGGPGGPGAPGGP